MKELTRLKTITSKGKVFLSPFVFTEEEAKRRIESALKSFEEGTETRTELIRVSKYPLKRFPLDTIAVWSKKKHGRGKKSIRSLISYIKMLKLRWEETKDANNRESA